MILSFSVFKEKILDGTKTQTIRPYNEFQWKRFCNAKKYQLYWHNPRNGGKLIKEVEPMEQPFLIQFYESKYSKDGQPEQIHIGVEKVVSKYTTISLVRDILAQRDGFKNFKEMFEWFEERYGGDMFTKKFMILRWKP